VVAERDARCGELVFAKNVFLAGDEKVRIFLNIVPFCVAISSLQYSDTVTVPPRARAPLQSPPTTPVRKQS
jgi:hypothetical protein